MLTAWVEVGEAEGTGGVCMSERKGKPAGIGRRTGWRQGAALEAGFLVRGQGASASVRSPRSLFASWPWGRPDWSFPFVPGAATLLPCLSFPLDVPEFLLVAFRFLRRLSETSGPPSRLHTVLPSTDEPQPLLGHRRPD